jgi:hypothetical protein
MSTRQTRKRIEDVERRVYREHDGTYTLTEVCRCLWQHDKKAYLEQAKREGGVLQFLVSRFEREDAAEASTK